MARGRCKMRRGTLGATMALLAASLAGSAAAIPPPPGELYPADEARVYALLTPFVGRWTTSPSSMPQADCRLAFLNLICRLGTAGPVFNFFYDTDTGKMRAEVIGDKALYGISTAFYRGPELQEFTAGRIVWLQRDLETGREPFHKLTVTVEGDTWRELYEYVTPDGEVINRRTTVLRRTPQP
jgi:hypothetical protein